MPLSDSSYPFMDDDGQTRIMDPATGQKYDVDPQGQAITPNGPEVPFWGAPTPKPTTTPMPTPTNPGFTPSAPQGFGNLPSVNIQPGLQSQQWEGTYNLGLAQERRLREGMEAKDIPQTRFGIDQGIFGIGQQQYANQVKARESQAALTGKIPMWLPKMPQFQQGNWRNYQEGGMVTPPGWGQPQGQQAPGTDAVYNTINGPKTIQQMEQELQAANWPGGEDVPTAYARTTGGPVTPRGG